MVEPISTASNVAHLETSRRRAYTKPPEDDQRPVIRIMPGESSRHVDEAHDVLVKANAGLYRYGERLVHILWDDIRVAGGGIARALRLFETTPANIRERLEKIARFEKWDVRANDFRVCGCPKDMPEMLLDRGAWLLPPLLGVVTAPTLRPDGSIIDTPGYDAATGIVYDPHGKTFPRIDHAPSKADAQIALAQLYHLLRGFMFTSNADRSVAISAIITACIRRAMPVAPMHAFSAPTPGSGKSMLVDIASVIATGWRAAVTSADDEKYSTVELGKRITASLLMGHSIISIDNVDRPLSGGFLCQCLSEHILSLRVLGLSKQVVTPNSAMYFATGNNLTIMNDATRRVLVGTLNPNVERPELRRFPFNAVKLALRARPKLVAHVLTIVRAYLASGERAQCTPLGSYEEWTHLVREPLVWLGQEDPAGVLEKVRADDPELAKTRALAAAWLRVIGGKTARVRDVIHAAMAQRAQDSDGEEDDYYENADLRDALRAVAEGKGREDISPDKLGWWLKRHRAAIVLVEGRSYRFASAAASGGHGVGWALEAVT